MTAYTAWYDHVMPAVPGALNAIVTQAIRRAVIEFCRLSLAYTYDPAAISIVASTSTYTITPPATTIVQDFVNVIVNGKEIDGHGEDWLDHHITDWRTTATGPAQAWFSPGANQIRLVPTPADAIASGLVVKVALRPLETSTTCPDWVFDDYLDAIRCGALERLYSMPGKPWTSGPLYAEMKREFSSWCEAAAAKSAQGGTRAPLRSAISF